MEKDMKVLKRVKIGMAIAVAVVWTAVGILGIRAIVELNDQEKREQTTIRVERDYLVNEYDKLKETISSDIVNIASLLQENPTLTFSKSDKDELLNSYSNIVNSMKNGETVDKVSVADEHNLDIYTAITIMNEDLKGFSTNFAVAIDNKNFNALDNSLKYLSKMVDTMNNMDKAIKQFSLK